MSLGHNFLRAQAEFVHKRALSICIFLALVTALTLPFASRLSLKANLIDLLPDDMPSVAQLSKLTAKVGGTSYLIVAIESANENAVIEASKQFAEKIQTLDQVDYVDNRTNVEAFKTSKFLFLTLESIQRIKKHVHDLIGFHRRKANPFYIDLLDEEPPVLERASLDLEERVNGIGSFAGRDSETYMRVVLVKPNFPFSDFDASEILFRDVKATLKEIEASLEAPLTVGFTGSYKTRYDEYKVIIADLNRTSLLTFLVITFLVCLFFRNIRSMLLATLALGVGIIWTCAFTQLAIGYLNLITTFLLAILFGLGISFAIHILVRYEEERKTAASAREALETTFVEVGEPLLSSALTTSIAFFSLTLSSFQGFNHFGLIAGVGIMLCFLSVFYGLTSFIVLGERFYRAKPRLQSLKDSWGVPKAGPIYVIILLGVIFSIYSLLNLRQVRFEYNFANLQEKNSESIIYADRIGKHFGVVLNPVGIITPSRAEAVKVAAKINRHAAQFPETAIDFAASILSHVPRDQKEKIRLLKDIDVMLEQRKQLIEGLEGDERLKIDELREQLTPAQLRLEQIPEGIRNQYEGKAENFSVVYVYPRWSLLDGQVAKKFVRELRGLDLGEYKLSGEPVIYADILTLLDKDTGLVMLVSLVLVIVLLFIHFRNVKHVLLVLSPVLMGFLWLGGLAVFTGFRFNYLNVTILPSILGVGIDSGIHIFHRYKREKKSTLFEIMQKTGLAVVLSSLTTMAAFASLFLAHHRGMSSLGQLGVMGFAGCLVAAVLFVPAIIEFMELKNWKSLQGVFSRK